MTPTEKTDLKAIIAQLQSYIDIDETYSDLILRAYEGDAQSAYDLASMVDNALSLQLRDMEYSDMGEVLGLGRRLYLYAARLGHPQAMYWCAVAGDIMPTDDTDDNAEFVSWLRKAADAGSLSAKAYYALLSVEGKKGVPQNTALAVRYADEVIALANKVRFNEDTCSILLHIAEELYLAEFLPYDPGKAMHYLHVLVTQGYGDALECYIEFLQEQEDDDDTAAFRCFQETLVLANEKPELPFTVPSAWSYLEEAEDKAPYLRHLQTTADAGNRYSMWMLGRYYREEGEHRDLRKSARWLEDAVLYGSADAIVDKAYRMFLRAQRHPRDLYKIIYNTHTLLRSADDLLSPTVNFYHGVLELAYSELTTDNPNEGLSTLLTSATDECYMLAAYLIAGLYTLKDTDADDDDNLYTGASFLNIVSIKLSDDHPHDLNPVFWQVLPVLGLDLPGSLVMLMDFKSPLPEEQSTIDSAVECLQRVLVMRNK